MRGNYVFQSMFAWGRCDAGDWNKSRACILALIDITAMEIVSKNTDCMTLSIEAGNFAFNNAAHAVAEFARQTTEGWATASKALRPQRPQRLDLAFVQRDRGLYAAVDSKAPCCVHIHSAYCQCGCQEFLDCHELRPCDGHLTRLLLHSSRNPGPLAVRPVTQCQEIALPPWPWLTKKPGYLLPISITSSTNDH